MVSNKTILEAAKVFGEAIHGDVRARAAIKQTVTEGHTTIMSEAMSSGDLQSAFKTAVKQTIEREYAELPRVWDRIAKRNTVEDFKPTYFREFDWDQSLQVTTSHGFPVAAGGLGRVPELTEYPTMRFKTAEKQFQIYKSGARFPFSWESVVDDDWGFIQSIPKNLMRLSLNTEENEAFGSFIDAAGPRADVFTGQSAVDNKPLTFDNLVAAKQAVRSRTVNGRPVTVGKFALVVPPALEEVAKQILSITTYELTDGDKKYTQTAGNGDVEIVVASAAVSLNKVKADSTWFLVPARGTDGVRDSVLLNFLRGHERPELRISGDTGLYVGGGNVPGLEGGMLKDEIEYRVRHVVTGFVLNSDAMYASVPA